MKIRSIIITVFMLIIMHGVLADDIYTSSQKYCLIWNESKINLTVVYDYGRGKRIISPKTAGWIPFSEDAKVIQLYDNNRHLLKLTLKVKKFVYSPQSEYLLLKTSWEYVLGESVNAVDDVFFIRRYNSSSYKDKRINQVNGQKHDVGFLEVTSSWHDSAWIWDQVVYRRYHGKWDETWGELFYNRRSANAKWYLRTMLEGRMLDLVYKGES